MQEKTAKIVTVCYRRRYQFEIECSDTILTLKWKIYGKIEIPVANQRLYFQGIAIDHDEDKFLSDFLLPDDATILVTTDHCEPYFFH